MAPWPTATPRAVFALACQLASAGLVSLALGAALWAALWAARRVARRVAARDERADFNSTGTL